MPKNPYQPPQKILEKYADILVNFALNSGEGVRSGEIVQIGVPDVAKALARELYRATLKAGAHPILRLSPTGFERDFYELANKKQLTHFPKKFLRAKADLLDHAISIIADPDPELLKDVDSKKIMLSNKSQYPFREWLFEKERRNKFTWTCALWGTAAKAEIVGLSLEEYWKQIIQACFLDKKNPIEHWKKLTKLQVEIQKKLNNLSIESLKIIGDDVDLTIKLGPNRIWKTGSGANIPSFEHFTSPDCRGTSGWIRFNQPLYRYGNIIEGVELEFKDGLVTNFSAQKGNKVLKDMIETKNANMVGEFSLTDKRLSRITHPMAETLFDENVGGPFGNTHIALGMAYKDCYRENAEKVSDEQWDEMGFNNSSVHTDIVSTTDRVVTATLTSGKTVVIYKDGQFVL
jgi:aminopeptidase